MAKILSASAQRVQTALTELGYDYEVQERAETTRTAQEAADTVGCAVGQIVKSLIFEGKQTHKPILVVASGANRVDERTLGVLAGEPIKRASPEFVREHTGFAIGGVAPLGHPQPIETFVDADLLQYDELWAAAGTPNSLFKLTPAVLLKITNGKVATTK